MVRTLNENLITGFNVSLLVSLAILIIMIGMMIWDFSWCHFTNILLTSIIIGFLWLGRKWSTDQFMTNDAPDIMAKWTEPRI